MALTLHPQNDPTPSVRSDFVRQVEKAPISIPATLQAIDVQMRAGGFRQKQLITSHSLPRISKLISPSFSDFESGPTAY